MKIWFISKKKHSKSFLLHFHNEIKANPDTLPYGKSIAVVQNLKAAVRRCSFKTGDLFFLQNSQKNICVGVSSLIKLRASSLQHFAKKKTSYQRMCFPVDFTKIL